jgi:hypothetical protein
MGFGDVNKRTGKMDDLAISDNGDSRIILATLAAIVLDFLSHNPDKFVYARA